MKRESSHCDFCGAVQLLKRYPTDAPGIDWYACPDCVEIIQCRDWGKLAERSLAAYATLRSIPDDEQNVVRRQVENLVKAFRTLCLRAA
jgi:hypothetical protein